MFLKEVSYAHQACIYFLICLFDSLLWSDVLLIKKKKSGNL